MNFESQYRIIAVAAADVPTMFPQFLDEFRGENVVQEQNFLSHKSQFPKYIFKTLQQKSVITISN